MTTPRETCGLLADLLAYPTATVPVLDDCDVIADSVAAEPLVRFRHAAESAGVRVMQEHYVEAFDLNPANTLDVGWHLLGDAPERAAFLSLLREDLGRAGVAEGGELPDHLPVLLRLIAREEEAAASELASFIAPAVGGLRDRLMAGGNPYGDVMDAVARVLEQLHPNEVKP